MVTLPVILQQLRETLLPPDIPTHDVAPSMRQAAVLILLFPRAGSIRFLLTVRPDTLTHHAGQVSLPGGNAESHDRTLWDTAVRECREELGIRAGRLRPLGRLEPVHLGASNHLIWPFVGWNPIVPHLNPDPAEVARVVEAPLSLLLDSTAVAEEEWLLRDSMWLVTFYRVEDLVVWGATARVLSDLASHLHEGTSHIVGPPGSMRPLPT